MAADCPTMADEALATYTVNKIEGASPAELVLICYDHVLGCCRRREMMRAKDGVVQLMGALDLDYLDVSGPLFRIYEYLLDIIRAERYEEAEGILCELREAWVKAMEGVASEQGPSVPMIPKEI
ncbi:MAG: flagellar protein FliS [Candidatus Eisenbacteria bacterium]|nr:flagellar protein FliS [Candidatus Eisenbacteria bacterium]